MRRIILGKIGLFLIIFLTIVLLLSAEEIKTIKAKEIWTIRVTSICDYRSFLSSDGSMVAWKDGHNKIFVVKIGTVEKIEIGEAKELFGWLVGSNEYLMTEKGFLSVKTKKIISRIENIPDKILCRAGLLCPDPPYFDEIEKIYPFWVIQNGQIKKVYSSGEPYNFVLFGDKSERKRIILFQNGIPIYINDKSKDNHVFNITPSPLNNKFILEYYGGSVVIFPKENKTYDLPGKYGFSWSPDGQTLIFAKVEDDGHKATSGELFICNWDGTNVRHIVFGTSRIRKFPSFGPNDLITYIILDIKEKGERWEEKYYIGVAKLLF